MTKENHGGNIYRYSQKVLDFSANLNPLGMAPEIKSAIIENIDKYETYPDTENRQLSRALSEDLGVGEEHLCFGNGAADLIFRIVLAKSPKKALLVSPTFSEYEEALRITGTEIEHFFLKEADDFTLGENVLDSIDEGYDILFICNPNNPTGMTVDAGLMERIGERCREKDVLLVVDECFMEFVEDEEKYSLMGKVSSFPNLVILKAFTKIYAMAGLRLGYAVFGSRDFAEKVRGTLQPWAVSTVASKAGVAALSLKGYVEETKSLVRENREFLKAGLERLGYKVFPSKANYMMFKGERQLRERLEEKGILLRGCHNYHSLNEEFFRVAVRPMEEIEKLLEALARVKTALNQEKSQEVKNG